MNDPVVSTAWLAERLGEPGVRVLDATWFLPAAGRDAKAEHAAAHIPGAGYFDIDAVADRASPLPHMLPAPDAFAAAASMLGIGDGKTVVAYDANGLIASARLWWSLRAMGHDQVVVLDGGLEAWRAEDRPVEAGAAARPAPASFTPRFRPELVQDFEAVRAGGRPVVDARSASRFRGEAAEPRAGLRAGHIPGATNLPYGELLTAEGRLRPAADLERAFEAAGVARDAPLTASCGSGVSACVIALALARLGRWDTAVYDGSWTDWGGRADASVATGA